MYTIFVWETLLDLVILSRSYEGVLISPKEGKKLQRPNSGFIQHTPHEAQYTSDTVAVTFASHSKKIGILSFQPGLRGSNDLNVGRKMATFQLCFQSREQVVVRRGQICRIRWMIKILEAQAGQFLMGYQCTVSRGTAVQE